MFKSSISRIALVMVLFIAGGEFVSAQQKVIADKIVAVIGNSSVLYSEVNMMGKSILDQRKKDGYTSDRDAYCEALENLMIQKLLYNQAQIDSLDAPVAQVAMAVSSMLDQEIAMRGSTAAVEAFYHKPIYTIRQDLTAQYTEMELAKAMQREIRSKVSIGAGEVEKYYKKISKDDVPMIPEQYTYAHIVKYPLSIEDAKLRTRTRLLEMRARIVEGANFGALARMYSQDPGSALSGGEMDYNTREGFLRPFGDAMVRLKPNQVSEVVETEYGFHIIQLIDVKGNLYRVRHILLRPEYTAEEVGATANAVDSILTRIHNNELTFEKAAEQYSEDKYSKRNKGTVTNHEYLEQERTPYASLTSTRFFKEELNPNDYNVLKGMKVGDISPSFMSEDTKGNILAKTIMLMEIIPSHPATLKDDFTAIENMALQEKQQEAVKKWVEAKAAGMYINVDPEFKNCEFEYPVLLK